MNTINEKLDSIGVGLAALTKAHTEQANGVNRTFEQHAARLDAMDAKLDAIMGLLGADAPAAVPAAAGGESLTAGQKAARTRKERAAS